MSTPTDFSTLLSQAETHLGSDAKLAALMAHVGPCTFAPDANLFAVTCRAVIAQLISTAAAKTITLRFHKVCRGQPTPGRVAKLTPETLKTCGISGAKARTILELAQHFQTHPKFPRQLAAAPDAEARKLLLPLFGIGPWTVDMVLIFGLGRMDVLPVGDLGLRAAVRDLHALSDLPDPATLTALAEPWRPFRSIATWFLWRSRGWVPQSGTDGPVSASDSSPAPLTS